MRLVIINLVLLLLPAVAYFLVRWLRGHRDFSNGPIIRLLLSGLVLVIICLLWFRFNTGADPDSVYVPPHMENGELVGPQYVSPEDSGAAPGDVLPDDEVSP